MLGHASIGGSVLGEGQSIISGMNHRRTSRCRSSVHAGDDMLLSVAAAASILELYAVVV